MPMLHVPIRWTALEPFLIAIVFLAGLTGCGGQSAGRNIAWQTGTPPSTEPAPPPELTTQAPAAEGQPSPSPSPTVPPAPATTADAGATLTPEQLRQLRPNELGFIPVLEYHNFVEDPKDEAQFARPLDDFRADLRWLYEHDFYVIPLRDLILNRIAAPAGKRPVVLTFDDSYASQFRVLVNADGTWTIDPDSAVGIMEEFFAAHPDFGRGGFFAV
ncbi:MAG: hypothetical protein C4345_10480, partial [Chloroflexota bacterium]